MDVPLAVLFEELLGTVANEAKSRFTRRLCKWTKSKLIKRWVEALVAPDSTRPRYDLRSAGSEAANARRPHRWWYCSLR